MRRRLTPQEARRLILLVEREIREVSGPLDYIVAEKRELREILQWLREHA